MSDGSMFYSTVDSAAADANAIRGAMDAARSPISVTLPAEDSILTAPARGQLQMFWDAYRAHRMAMVGLVVLSFILLSCIVLPFFLAPPTTPDWSLLRATPPSMAHPLGTDTIGRDVLSRLVSAGRISLQIGFCVALFSVVIGSIVGCCAGYFGGKVDAGLTWIVNVLQTIPALPLLIAVAVLIASPDSAFGAVFRHLGEAWRITFVLSFLGWMGISRVVRSQVISLREQEFVEAARALGARAPRVMFIHILPNSISVIAVFTTLAVSGGIMAESVLSFLGVGVNPPTATWGNMLNEARDLFSILEYWWLVWFPAICIFLTVLSVNFVGDGIRDALDPKARRR